VDVEGIVHPEIRHYLLTFTQNAKTPWVSSFKMDQKGHKGGLFNLFQGFRRCEKQTEVEVIIHW